MENATFMGIFGNVTVDTNKTIEGVSGDTNDTGIDGPFSTTVMWNVIYGVSFISVTLNTFNIYVIVSSRLYQQLSYALVLNLSFCDAFVSFSVSVYSIVVDTEPDWLEIMWLTVLIDYIFGILSFATLLTVLSMTCDLFYMITMPLQHRRRFKDSKKYHFVIACIWILASVPAILLDYVIPLFNTERTKPYLEEATSDLYEPYWFSLAAAIICFFTMVILYSIIIKEIYKSHKLNQRRKMRKTAVTVCLIVLTYFLLYLPYWITVAAWVLDSIVPNTETELFDQIYLLTFLLTFINTACDPLIYAFRIKKIRQSARKIFCKWIYKLPCQTRGQRPSVTSISTKVTESTRRTSSLSTISSF